MRARGSIQSPVLVGRDSFLALVEDRLAAAAAGEGRLLFVAGEAGIGKTRLLSAVARRAEAGGFAVVRAAAFPDDVQSLAGLLLDLAGNLLPAPSRRCPSWGGALRRGYGRSPIPPATRTTGGACWYRIWPTCW